MVQKTEKPPDGWLDRIAIRSESGRLIRGFLFLEVGVVDHLLQLGAGLEHRDVLGFDFDALTGARVAADARPTLLDRERAEVTNFDARAIVQRRDDGVENELNGFFGFPVRKGAVSGEHSFAEFGFSKRRGGHDGNFAFKSAKIEGTGILSTLVVIEA